MEGEHQLGSAKSTGSLAGPSPSNINQPPRTSRNWYYWLMASAEASERRANPPDVMTVEQLSAYLQIAKSTLYKLAQEGRVPGQKVGKHWRFKKDAIDRWLEAQPEGHKR